MQAEQELLGEARGLTYAKGMRAKFNFYRVLCAVSTATLCFFIFSSTVQADPKKVEKLRRFYKEHGLDFFGDLISDQVDSALDEKRHAKLELLADDARTKALKQLDTLLRSSRGSSMEAELLIRKATLLADRARTATFFQNSSVKSSKLKPPRSYLEESTKVFLEVERKFPRHPRMDVVLFSIGYNYGEMGTAKVDSAFTYYKKTVDKFPESPLVGDARLAMSEILFDKRKFQESVNQLKEIVKSNHPRLKNFALYKMAWSYYNLADLDSAMLSLEKAIEGVNQAEGAQRARLELRKEALNDLAFFYSEKPGAAAEVANAAVEYFDRVAETPSEIAQEYAQARQKRIQTIKERKGTVPDEDLDEMLMSEPNEQLLRLTNVYRDQGKHEQALIVAGHLLQRLGKHPKAVALYRLRAEAAEKLRRRDTVIKELTSLAATMKRDIPPVDGFEKSLPTLKTPSMGEYFEAYDFRSKEIGGIKTEWPIAPTAVKIEFSESDASLYKKNLATIGTSTFKDFAHFFHGEFNKTGNLESAKNAAAVYELIFDTFASPWRAVEIPQLFDFIFPKAALHFAQKNWSAASRDFEWLALRVGRTGAHIKKDQDFEAAIKSLIASDEAALKEKTKDTTLQQRLLQSYDLYLATHLSDAVKKATDRTTTATILAASARLAHEMKSDRQALHRMQFHTLHFDGEKDAIALAKDASARLEKLQRWEDLRDFSAQLLESKNFSKSDISKDIAKSQEYASLKLLETLEEAKDWNKASDEFAKFAEKNPNSSFVSQALIKAARATIETGDLGEAVDKLEKATKAPDAKVRTQALLALEPYYRKAFLWFELQNSYETLLKLKLGPKDRAATEQNLKTIKDLNHAKFVAGGAKLIDTDPDVAKLENEQRKFEASTKSFFSLRFQKSNNNPQGNFKKKADQHKALTNALDKVVGRAPKSLRGSATLWASIVKTELLTDFAETLETAALPDVLKQATETDRKAYIETIMGNARELREQATSMISDAAKLAREVDYPFDFETRLNNLLEKLGIPQTLKRPSFQDHWQERPRFKLSLKKDAGKTREEIRKLGRKLLSKKEKEETRSIALEIAENYAELGEHGLAYATAAILREEDGNDETGRRAGKLQWELDVLRLPKFGPHLSPSERWDLARYLTSFSKRCAEYDFDENDCEWIKKSPEILLRSTPN